MPYYNSDILITGSINPETPVLVIKSIVGIFENSKGLF